MTEVLGTETETRLQANPVNTGISVGPNIAGAVASVFKGIGDIAAPKSSLERVVEDSMNQINTLKDQLKRKKLTPVAFSLAMNKSQARFEAKATQFKGGKSVISDLYERSKVDKRVEGDIEIIVDLTTGQTLSERNLADILDLEDEATDELAGFIKEYPEGAARANTLIAAAQEAGAILNPSNQLQFVKDTVDPILEIDNNMKRYIFSSRQVAGEALNTLKQETALRINNSFSGYLSAFSNPLILDMVAAENKITPGSMLDLYDVMSREIINNLLDAGVDKVGVDIGRLHDKIASYRTVFEKMVTSAFNRDSAGAKRQLETLQITNDLFDELADSQDPKMRKLLKDSEGLLNLAKMTNVLIELDTQSRLKAGVSGEIGSILRNTRSSVASALSGARRMKLHEKAIMNTSIATAKDLRNIVDYTRNILTSDPASGQISIVFLEEYFKDTFFPAVASLEMRKAISREEAKNLESEFKSLFNIINSRLKSLGTTKEEIKAQVEAING